MPVSDPTVTQHKFWELKKYKEHEWYRFLVLLLLILVTAYLLSHIILGRLDPTAGYEYVKLDKEQIQQIDRIYFSNVDDSLAVAVTDCPADSPKVYRVVDYIRVEFSNKVDSAQLQEIFTHLLPAKPLEATGFLGNIRLRIRSYFWLTGPEVYFEIVFWSWFGVIASLLFNLGMVARNKTTNLQDPATLFDSSEIPYQFAKLFYAPLCTLALVLGYNYFTDENIVDISSSKGVIVFAFVGGFYSARVVALLDRLKEVLLPNGSIPESQSITTASQTMLANIKVLLELDDSFTPEEVRNDIIEIGLGNATVILKNEVDGELISASREGEDQSAVFSVPNLKAGRYTIQAALTMQIADNAPVNLEASQIEELKASDTSVVLKMKKSQQEG
jgi:hypothetical protein